MARRKLAENVYATVAGTDRRALERITFRPRLMVNVSKLDLTTELLGETMFAPILVGPMAKQQTFHPEGEVAMARGASAAKTVMIVSSRSSRPLTEIAVEAKTPLWFQVYPEPDIKETIKAAQDAVRAGCKAVCLTVGVPSQSPGKLKMDWALIDQVRQSVKAPLVLKGIMSAEEAEMAVTRGVQAIVVSNYGGSSRPGLPIPSRCCLRLPTLSAGRFRF